MAAEISSPPTVTLVFKAVITKAIFKGSYSLLLLFLHHDGAVHLKIMIVYYYYVLFKQ